MAIFDFKIKNGILEKYRGRDANVVIPEGVRELAPEAFKKCKSMKTVSFPSSLSIIGVSSFEGCVSLTELTVPKTVCWILQDAFKNCTSLRSVKLYCSVNSIYYNAFSGCTSLKSVEINHKITSIGVGAFSGCTSLESITIPEGLSEISAFAFSSCTSLEKLIVPDSVRKIGDYAFLSCTKATVSVPEGAAVADKAFERCKEVIYRKAGERIAVLPTNEVDAEVKTEVESPITPNENTDTQPISKVEEGPAVALSAESKPSENLPENRDQSEESKYVFISYSTKNQDYAEAVRRLVKEENISAWMAPYDIPAGSKYAHVINSAIKKCSCVLLLLSEQSQQSEWVEKEIERAINYRKTVISMHIDESQLNDGFSFYLGNQQIVPIKSINKNDANILKVLNAIKSFVM